MAFAKAGDSAAASAGLDFPAQELLDVINVAIEVRRLSSLLDNETPQGWLHVWLIIGCMWVACRCAS